MDHRWHHLVAIIGKMWGTHVACRVVGESKQDSLYMGILMNTRGLMSLVILSMGLVLGILSPVIRDAGNHDLGDHLYDHTTDPPHYQDGGKAVRCVPLGRISISSSPLAEARWDSPCLGS